MNTSHADLHALRREKQAQPRPLTRRGVARRFAVAAALLALAGCSLTPGGLDGERRSMEAGREWKRGGALSDLPEPAGGDDWRTLLRRALLANGDVRAAWFDWKAAVEKVSGAAAWPNSNISLGFSYLFSGDRVKSFDRTSFTAGFDSMQNLSFPGKPMTSGRAALEDARSTGERFRATKFALQRRVLEAWLDLAGAAEDERLAAETISLAGVGSDVADAALGAGGDQRKALGARMLAAKSDDSAAAARARVAGAKAMLAALTATDPPDRIGTPTRLPDPRELPADASVLVDAVDDGPAVKGMEADRRARVHEKDLAKLQWIPDINPTAAVTGSIEQSVGAILVLPTKIAEIRSGIAVAKALRGAAASRLVQARRDQLGELRTALLEARGDERARRLLEDRVVPAATSTASAAESAYSAGRAEISDLLEARRTLIDVRSEVAVAAIEREKKLAAIEEILGADLETFTALPPTRIVAAAEVAAANPASTTAASTGTANQETPR